MTLYELIEQGFWLIENHGYTVDSYLAYILGDMGVDFHSSRLVERVLVEGKTKR